MMIGFGIRADSIVHLLLTDKWLPSVPYIQIFCIIYAFYPIHTANLNTIKAMGRSDLFLALEIIKKIISLILILSSMWFGVMAMVLSSLVGSVLRQMINAWLNRKSLNYKYHEQLLDLLLSLVLSLLMGAIVYSINFLHLSSLIKLLLQIPLGVIIYFVGAWLFKFDSLSYCISIAKNYVNQISEIKNKIK